MQTQVQTQVQFALEFAFEMPPKCLPGVSQAQTQVQSALESALESALGHAFENIQTMHPHAPIQFKHDMYIYIYIYSPGISFKELGTEFRFQDIKMSFYNKGDGAFPELSGNAKAISHISKPLLHIFKHYMDKGNIVHKQVN